MDSVVSDGDRAEGRDSQIGATGFAEESQNVGKPKPRIKGAAKKTVAEICTCALCNGTSDVKPWRVIEEDLRHTQQQDSIPTHPM